MHLSVVALVLAAFVAVVSARPQASDFSQAAKPPNRLLYKFKSDAKSLVDPTNDASQWRWARASQGDDYIADGGSFSTDNGELNAQPFKKSISTKKRRVAGLAGYQAVIVNKQNFTVDKGQKLTAHFSFACELSGQDKSPYPAAIVSNPADDPTLGNCAMALAAYGDAAVVFSIVATNKGIWAVYERNRFELVSHPERPDRLFTIFKRIGDRSSSSDAVGGAVQYDRAAGKVNYMLNGKVVWTIDSIGTLPSSGGAAVSSVFTSARPDLVKVDPSQFQVWFGLTDYLDIYDPNSPKPGQRRSRLVAQAENFYDAKSTFFDDAGDNQKNLLWGQGGVMKPQQALIKLE